jgi:hypothetical protein
MGKLTDVANERIKRNSGASLPDWTPILGVVVAGLTVLIMVVSAALGGSDPITDPSGPGGGGVIPGGRPTTTVAEITDTDPGTGPGTDPTTPATTTVGGETSADAELVALVKAVAVARVTGNTQSISVLAGAVVPPPLIGPGAAPKVGAVTLVTGGETPRYTVVVDPDGAGPSGEVVLGVSLARSPDGTWVWNPAGSTDPG